MAGYNYFASPSGSERAKAFRAAYGNAPMGQDFWFENQPYARPGPPGLLAEEGAGTATGYRPIERMNPNDQAYMSPAMLAEIAAKEANRKRLGARISGRTKVLRDRPVWEHFEKRWVEPEGSFVQSPHGLEAVEQDAINARYASGNPPRFPGRHHSPDLPYSVTGRSGHGQDPGPPPGLLSEPTVDSKSKTSRYTDEHGWTKDRQMRDANLQMANLLLNYGEQSRNDGWDSELTHY